MYYVLSNSTRECMSGSRKRILLSIRYFVVHSDHNIRIIFFFYSVVFAFRYSSTFNSSSYSKYHHPYHRPFHIINHFFIHFFVFFQIDDSTIHKNQFFHNNNNKINILFFTSSSFCVLPFR